MSVAGRDETQCNELSANCTWSKEEQVCYSIIIGHSKDGLYGSDRKRSAWKDACVTDVGRDKNRCNELSANCTWSEEEQLCYSTDREHPEDHSYGSDSKHSSWKDGCMIVAGHDLTKCNELSANCSWSKEQQVCYSTQRKKDDHEELGEDDHAQDQTKDKQIPFGSSVAVDVTLRLNNIQFSLLSANPAVLVAFKSRMQSIIAGKAEQGILPEHISLEVKPGSVIVAAAIHPPSGTSVDKVHQDLSQNLLVLEDMAQEVGQVPGIQAATSGPITMSLVSAPTVRNTLKANVPDASDSNRLPVPSIMGAIAGGAAMLAFVSLACCLCTRVRQGAKANPQTKAEVVIQLDV
jgi:hypothetical protein